MHQLIKNYLSVVQRPHANNSISGSGQNDIQRIPLVDLREAHTQNVLRSTQLTNQSIDSSQ